MESNTSIVQHTFVRRDCIECAALNDGIFKQFLDLEPESILHSSHLFEGRHENIYVRDDVIGHLKEITEISLRLAAETLGTSPSELKLGWWFNYMQPGQRTLPHSHDDDDELLSGVYYVRVPAQSGNLILHDDHHVTEVEPQEGSFVFFPPDLMHEVTCNESGQARLSIGMNFGPRVSGPDSDGNTI